MEKCRKSLDSVGKATAVESMLRDLAKECIDKTHGICDKLFQCVIDAKENKLSECVKVLECIAHGAPLGQSWHANLTGSASFPAVRKEMEQTIAKHTHPKDLLAATEAVDKAHEHKIYKQGVGGTVTQT